MQLDSGRIAKRQSALNWGSVADQDRGEITYLWNEIYTRQQQ